MSFLRRFLRSIYHSRHFVGTDLEGNQFFEYPSLSDDALRTRRRVQYGVYGDMWDYVGGAKRLPVQWVSWLSHTRMEPPSLEELRADLERQRRVLHNAAIIQAKDQEERARITPASVSTVPELENPPLSTPQGIRIGENHSTMRTSDGVEGSLPSKIHNVKQDSRASHDSELPPFGKDRDWRPEAWTPRTTHRRGG